MHFIGMLAFRMPIELGYDVGITGLSLLIAISISYFALHVVTSNESSWRRLMVGGVMMGLGVAGMHYTGMAAMQMQPGIPVFRFRNERGICHNLGDLSRTGRGS